MQGGRTGEGCGLLWGRSAFQDGEKLLEFGQRLPCEYPNCHRTSPSQRVSFTVGQLYLEGTIVGQKQ